MKTYYYDVVNDEKGLPKLKELKEVEAWSCNNDEKNARLAKQVLYTEPWAEEKVYMVACDVSYNVLGIFKISDGDKSSASVSVEAVLVRALLVYASAVFLFHNHPCGNSEPSVEDYLIAKKLSCACRLIGIKKFSSFILSRKVTVINDDFISYTIVDLEENCIEPGSGF